MTPVRQNVAQPIQILWLTPYMIAFAVGTTVFSMLLGSALPGLGFFIAGIVGAAVSVPIAALQSLRDPDTDRLIDERIRRVLRVNAHGTAPSARRPRVSLGNFYVA